jgi:hypothetical protein
MTEPRGDLSEFFGTSQVLAELARAIRQGTGLRSRGEDPFDGNLAASDQHRVFTLEPGDATYLSRSGGGRWSEDSADLLVKKRIITITLTHDYDPGAHTDSYALADQDFEALEDAVLTRDEAFRVAQPEITRATCRRVGHSIVQTLVLNTTLGRQLPPSQG